jgi:drug/metabolite transporter (DMT)-like permease
MSWAVAVAIGITVIIWASAFVAIRIGLKGYSPVQLAALRFFVAAALFGVRAWLVGICIPDRRDWPHLFITGVVGFTFYILLVTIGETHVSAGMASFVVNTVPVFTAILAVLFLRERMGSIGWIGLVISMTGSALLAFGTSSRLDFEPYVLILLAAAITQAAYFAMLKPLVNRYGGVTVTSWAVWSGTLCLLPSLPSALRATFTAPISATLSALYLGVLPTVVGYAAWAFVVSRMPVGRAAAYLYFIPVAATLIGWLVLHERPVPLGVLGGLIAISGVTLVNLQPRGKTPNVTPTVCNPEPKHVDALN